MSLNRRDFLKLLVGLPVLGGVAMFVSPLFRYLRPSSGPALDSAWATTDDKGNPLPFTDWSGDKGLVTPADAPQREKNVTFDLASFPNTWDYQPFTFGQLSKEYTFRHFQATKIPGFIVRLPKPREDGKPDFMIVSRICPHMGCVFNFLPDPSMAASYNYPQAKNPLFACPCHLSVYDPLQYQTLPDGETLRGKVVSGPAPRPPRRFFWEYNAGGDQIIVSKAESGGIS